MNLGSVADPKTAVIDEMEIVYGPLVHIGPFGSSTALCGWKNPTGEAFGPESIPGAVCQKCCDAVISLYYNSLP